MPKYEHDINIKPTSLKIPMTNIAEVIEEDEFGQSTEVELIAHSKSRDEIYRCIKIDEDEVHMPFLYRCLLRSRY